MENRRLASGSGTQGLDGIVCASPLMLAACRMVEKVGPADVTALIAGESGTGKELFARALHRLSRRRDEPFVAVNCAAIPETLLESELFGYEKGAFTGAVRQTPGKIEYADGGTFFLDEIGDMPLSIQAKMLRFLQERVIERLGGPKSIPVDVRVVCATHQDLSQSIRTGAFREDLYYRISAIVIEVPPLKAREDDSLLLAHVFLERHARDSGRSFSGFAQDALEQIAAYPWPGNVRELENRVRRAVILAEGRQITALDLGFEPGSDESPGLDLRQAREVAERSVILRALGVHNHNMSHTAAALGISRPSLYNLMKKLDIGWLDDNAD
jgi:two-component system NtrC family response regulator